MALVVRQIKVASARLDQHPCPASAAALAVNRRLNPHLASMAIDQTSVEVIDQILVVATDQTSAVVIGQISVVEIVLI